MKSKEKSRQLFASLSFILLTDCLNRTTIQNVSIEILENGGGLETVECGTTDQSRRLKADYLLCDPRLDANEIRETLPQSMSYKQALNISFVQACLAAGKVLPIGSYKLRTNLSKQQEGPKKRTKTQKVEQTHEKKQEKGNEARKAEVKKDRLKDITKPSNNKFIIEQLSKLLKVYTNEGDKGRKIAYSRAIGSIKSLDYELETDEDVQKLKTTQKHIGDKIVDKIKELLKTGSINKLERLQNTQQNIALEQITRVWGIGAAKAKQMYERGVRTIEDLKREVQKYPDILTKNQKVGLKYVNDLEIRIPRKKVTLMLEVVRETLFELVGSRDLHQVQACGSYRRQKQTCGDMDVFITRKDGQYEKHLLTKLVDRLKQKRFLTDDLVLPRHIDNRSSQSYMGICQYQDDLHHRIDIKYYLAEQFAFAVLYFTGSDMFNRKMRLEAIEKGYHLSDKGMYKFHKNSDKTEDRGADIKCRTEKQIFEVLQIQYKQPKDRDI